MPRRLGAEKERHLEADVCWDIESTGPDREAHSCRDVFLTAPKQVPRVHLRRDVPECSLA